MILQDSAGKIARMLGDRLGSGRLLRAAPPVAVRRVAPPPPALEPTPGAELSALTLGGPVYGALSRRYRRWYCSLADSFSGSPPPQASAVVRVPLEPWRMPLQRRRRRSGVQNDHAAHEGNLRGPTESPGSLRWRGVVRRLAVQAVSTFALRWNAAMLQLHAANERRQKGDGGAATTRWNAATTWQIGVPTEPCAVTLSARKRSGRVSAPSNRGMQCAVPTHVSRPPARPLRVGFCGSRRGKA